MRTVVVKSGAVTVTLSGELQARINHVINTAYAGVRDQLDGIGETLVTDAEAAWYTQVQRRTGATGDIEHEMRLSGTELQVAVKAEQTDKTYLVRRPGALSRVVRRSTDAEYSAAMSQYRRTGQLPKEWTEMGVRFDAGRPTGLRKSKPNPLASDGKNMWQENVRKPGKALGALLVRNGSEALSGYMRKNGRR